MAGNEGQTTQSNNAAAENFSIRVTALSPLHLGSGKGDVTIDAEVVHDAVGLPYFPAKRLKGLLYESALEVVEIMDADPIFSADEVKALFRHGTKTRTGAQLIVSNLHLENYETMRREWSFLEARYPELIQPRDVLEQYTSLRYQTKSTRIREWPPILRCTTCAWWTKTSCSREPFRFCRPKIPIG